MAKYHNFKLLPPSGQTWYFISKCGHSSNVGTDPNAPRLGFISGVNTFVVGAGHYVGGSVATTAASQVSLKGDGKVILEGMATTAGAITEASDIIFKNWTNLKIRGVFSLRCHFINCPISTITNNCSISVGSIARLCTFSSTIDVRLTILSAIIINCTGSVYSVLNSFVDADSELTILFDINSALNYSNYRGLVRLRMSDGITYKSYAVKDQYTGTPQQAGYGAGVNWLSEAQLLADGYGGPVAGLDNNLKTCINRAPLFNDLPGEDYTYRADSPNVRRASDGSNIGGQRVAASILNTDHGNLAGVKVIPSEAINTANATAYELNPGYDEGYVDYVFFNSGLTLTNLDLKDLFTFNSDVAGGNVGNKNVPDAEPITAEYANRTSTTAAAPAANLLIVPAGKIAVGKHVRVNGQCREVVGKTSSGGNDTLTLDSNLLAAIGSGVIVSYGTASQLAAVNPNRLTVYMRTKSTAAEPSYPFNDQEWDNELDPVYNKVGYFFNQEINAKPVLFIDGLNVYGSGDSDAPVGLAEQELAPQWIHVRVYKRNNYTHTGVLS